MTPPIVSIIGKSKSGKTTLMEKLIPELRQRGYRVATVKHHAHADIPVDMPGKDTWRHATAGAELVAIVSSRMVATFEPVEQEPALDDVVGMLEGVDLVLAEGFSRAGKPAIEVSRRARSTQMIGVPGQVFAVAADYTPPTDVPVYGLDEVVSLADLLVEQIQAQRTAHAAVAEAEALDGVRPLIINGKKVHPQLLESYPMQRCDFQQCQATCCCGGVWIDVGQAEFILQHAAEIKPYLRPEAQNPADWFDGEYDDDPDYPTGRGQGTCVIEHPQHPEGEACIFLTGDFKCGLQVAAIEQGHHPWHFKPYYCALHPLTTWDGWLMLEQDSDMVNMGGSCWSAGPLVPVYELFAEEIKLHLGEDGHAILVRTAEQKQAGQTQTADPPSPAVGAAATFRPQA